MWTPQKAQPDEKEALIRVLIDARKAHDRSGNFQGKIDCPACGSECHWVHGSHRYRVSCTNKDCNVRCLDAEQQHIVVGTSDSPK